MFVYKTIFIFDLTVCFLIFLSVKYNFWTGFTIDDFD